MRIRYKTIILPLAKSDIKEAALWYNKQRQGLGKRFTQQVRSKVKTIKVNPHAYSIRYDNVHTASIDIFPFMIHFVIEEEQKIYLYLLYCTRAKIQING
ncbi:MAG: type II toxin-antitoxin system RelE/ParE family toxin [Ginsengibacter sp.]